MQNRFPDKGNYVEEYLWPQDENGYDRDAYRIKCFRSYVEYLDDEDPLFYYENSEFITAPAFYAPRKEQEINKPPKFIQIPNYDEVISEELMKESFCLWDGNFEASEQEFFSPIFPRHMDSAMFNNGQVIKMRDIWNRDVTKVSYDIKLSKWKRAQSHAKSTNFETYSKTFPVKDRETGEYFDRLSDKAMMESDFNMKNFGIQTLRRKITARKALKMYDERAAYRHLADYKYIKISPDQTYDLEKDSEENCSFFQLVLNAFYFEEGNYLIYKEGYATIPLHQVRSLKELKYRKKRGWSFLKPNFKFKSFIKKKYSIYIKSVIQGVKVSYVIFDFTYITSALKVIYVRIESAFKIVYGYEIWVFIIKAILWLIDRVKSTEEEIEKAEVDAHNSNKQKILNCAKRIIIKTMKPKTIVQSIRVKINKMKKSIKDKYFTRKKRKR